MDYQEKMAKIKKLVSITFIASLILAVAMIILLICFNFAGVFSIKTLPGTKYENGFTYPGWQSLYFGMGNMMIQGYTEFTFDIYTTIGLYLPLLATIICTIIYLKNKNTKGTNKKKAILEFIMAGTILIGSILLFNCDNFTIANAAKVTGSYQDYYGMYLTAALEGNEYFRKEAYPYIILIVGIITALVKGGNGALLLIQKATAKKAK